MTCVFSRVYAVGICVACSRAGRCQVCACMTCMILFIFILERFVGFPSVILVPEMHIHMRVLAGYVCTYVYMHMSEVFTNIRVCQICMYMGVCHLRSPTYFSYLRVACMNVCMCASTRLNKYIYLQRQIIIHTHITFYTYRYLYIHTHTYRRGKRLGRCGGCKKPPGADVRFVDDRQRTH